MMKAANYIEQRDYLIDYYMKDLQIRGNDFLNGQLQLVSAGLTNYLPAIDIKRHADIFKQVLLHKKLSILEQADYGVLNYVQTEGIDEELLDVLKKKAVVICTFHTGSYRVLNLFLCKHKIPYSLVIGNDLIKNERALFTKCYQQLPGKESNDCFEIINAEDAHSGLQMLRALKRGRCLLLYIDGNTGAGAKTVDNENSCRVNFLHQQLFVRKGIAFLAHMANVPLLTVASYRKNMETICLKFFDLIYPDGKQTREDFAASTTQFIYDKIAPIIKTYPEQWEAWLYIHKVANIINIPAEKKDDVREFVSEKISFDSTRFGIFKANEKHFLLKKHSYSFFEISTQLYDFLMRCCDTAIDRNYLSQDQFQQLRKEGVITCV